MPNKRPIIDIAWIAIREFAADHGLAIVGWLFLSATLAFVLVKSYQNNVKVTALTGTTVTTTTTTTSSTMSTATTTLCPTPAPCPSPTPTPRPASAENIGKVVLRLHGSKLIGEELAPALAKAFLTRELRTLEPTQIPGRAPWEQYFVGVHGGEKMSVCIQTTGSDAGFKDLIFGECDVGLSVREASDKEKRRAECAGLGTLRVHELAYDAIVVIAHKESSLNNLTKQELSDKFFDGIPASGRGSISPQPLKLYIRDRKSGISRTFRNIVVKDKKEFSGNAEEVYDCLELAKFVSSDIHAIGFASFHKTKDLFAGPNCTIDALKIKLLEVDGVYPDEASIETKRYPLSLPFYLYDPEYPEGGSSSITKRFIEYATKALGQEIVRTHGYKIAQNGQTSSLNQENLQIGYRSGNTRSASAPPDFVTMVKFAKNRSDIPEDEKKKLRGLREELIGYQNSNRRIYVKGYACKIGDEKPTSPNKEFSRLRAKAVQEEIIKIGVKAELDKVMTTWFGSENPISSSESDEEELRKNRRAEIWVEKPRNSNAK
ncbi:MAG: substrate-binding domain-containing protein [Deltaproteobacteria bacterium]|nr:substrate-binding domain-containing protein [Deltaproteobacteria bacterium]